MNLIYRAAAVTAYLTLSTLALMAQNAEELFQQGNYLNREGRYEEALVYVDSSLRIDSSLYQRYYFRAEIKFKLGLITPAMEDITRCINKCNCPTRKYHVSEYYLERAELHLQNSENDAALADTNKSIFINPENWKAYNFRSNLFIQCGNYIGAMTDLNKSVQLNDNEATTLIARGKLKIYMGDTEGACRDLSKVSGWGIDDYDSWLRKNCR